MHQAKDILIYLPFLCFMGGYFCIAHVLYQEYISTPLIVGLPLQDAVLTLTRSHLYGECIREVVSPEAIPGTVLEQDPPAGHNVKKHNAVAYIIAVAPPPVSAPKLLGLTEEAMSTQCATLGISPRIHTLAHSSAPSGHCFAQYPEEGTPLGPERRIDVYVSENNTQRYSTPFCRGKSLQMVREEAQKAGITITIAHSPVYASPSQSQESAWIVREQSPRCGHPIVAGKETLHLLVEPAPQSKPL